MKIISGGRTATARELSDGSFARDGLPVVMKWAAVQRTVKEMVRRPSVMDELPEVPKMGAPIVKCV